MISEASSRWLPIRCVRWPSEAVARESIALEGHRTVKVSQHRPKSQSNPRQSRGGLREVIHKAFKSLTFAHATGYVDELRSLRLFSCKAETPYDKEKTV